MQNENREDGGNPHWLDRVSNSGRTHFGRWPSSKERSRERILRDWYGSEHATNEILAHQSPATPAGQVLGELFSTLGLRRQFALDEMQRQWTQIVGNAVAAQSRPVSLRRKTLAIEVSNATLLHILEREQKPQVLESVQRACGEPIERIRFVPQGRYSSGGQG